MKTIIAILCALALVHAAAVTLATVSTRVSAVEFTKNSTNSSNADISFTLTVADAALPLEKDGDRLATICFQMEFSNHTVTGTRKNIPYFMIAYICANADNTKDPESGDCKSLEALYTQITQTGTPVKGSITIYSGTNGENDGKYGTGDKVATATIDSSFTAGSNTTAKSVSYKATGITPSVAAGAQMPNVTNSQYYRCWSNIESAKDSVDYGTKFTAAVNDVETAFTTTTNVTLGGRAMTYASATIVGSALAYLAF